MKKSQKIKTQKLLLTPVLIFSIVALSLIVKDKYIYPLIDRIRLNSDKYVREIKTKRGQYWDIKDKVVWNSKNLALRPPEIEQQRIEDKKVLSADPNTWIDVNLSNQSLCLFHSGGTNCFTVSTGLPYTPTPVGTYHIWIKIPSTLMAGPGYYLPGVPWTMYFYRGYGIHGTYWHNNFGHPMSHGCVNMRTPEAQFVYDRVSVGTRVVVHY